MLPLWMSWRYLTSKGSFLSLTTILSLLGMIIGVGALVASMAVFSGFETTLKHAVIDVVGHMMLVKRDSRIESLAELERQIYEIEPSVQSITPFVRTEAILASKGRISNVLVEGIDRETASKVVRIEKRLIEGKYSVESQNGTSVALLGKGLAKKMDLHVGDSFLVVVPQPAATSPRNFTPVKKKFLVGGLLDLGKYEFDQRMVVTSMQSVQSLSGIGDAITGVRIRMENDDHAVKLSGPLAEKLGESFFSINWFEINRNLFDAIRLEKMVIFLVILIIVVAACFNISSTLFISVLRRYSDISILKAVGAKRGFVIGIFTYQGLLIGVVGSALGILLGIFLSYGFFFLQEHFQLLAGEVYKLDRIYVEIRWTDLLGTFLAALFICFLSTLAPAWRGARLNPVEGLRYE